MARIRLTIAVRSSGFSCGERESGGEPDVGLELPSWLTQSGFEIVSVRPVIDVVHATDFMWHWPSSFIDTYTDRLVESGHLEAVRVARSAPLFAAAEPGRTRC